MYSEELLFPSFSFNFNYYPENEKVSHARILNSPVSSIDNQLGVDRELVGH